MDRLLVQVISGLLLIIAFPTKAFTNPVFYAKMGLIAFAMVMMARLKKRIFDYSSCATMKGHDDQGQNPCDVVACLLGWSHYRRPLPGVYIQIPGCISAPRFSKAGSISGLHKPPMNFLNLAHQHLLLNHWPIIGTFMGFSVSSLSLWRQEKIT